MEHHLITIGYVFGAFLPWLGAFLHAESALYMYDKRLCTLYYIDVNMAEDMCI